MRKQILFLSFILYIGFLSVSSELHVCEKWKVPNFSTPESVITAWNEKDNNLYRFLSSTVPEALEHTGSTAFDKHLKGVQAVLRNWGADEYLTNSGLFHSIYGTQGFQGFSLSFSKREAIKNLIGIKAERLSFIFCSADRETVDNLVRKHFDNLEDLNAIEQLEFTIHSRLELGRFEINFPTENDWLDFLELTLADYLEQIEGASSKAIPAYGWSIGDAWGYRRAAYHQMSELLVARRGLHVAREMYEAVFAVESMDTKQIHHRLTPPVSETALEAQTAYAGRFIDWVDDAKDTC